jgi:activator of HSP90 ATPase
MSAWNAAGTWEERGHTAWASARLEALALERGRFAIDGRRIGEGDEEEEVIVMIDGVKKCEGDASVVMIRGKPRHGFDFEVTFTWSAAKRSTMKKKSLNQNESAEEQREEEEKAEAEHEDEDKNVDIKGTIHVPEASRESADDEECAFTIKVEDRKMERAEEEEACYAALKKGAETFLIDILKTLESELAERAKA